MRRKLILILFMPLTIIINVITKEHPLFIEKYYSNSINKVSRQIFIFILGLFPFSIGEFLVLLLLLALGVLVLVLIISIIKGGTIDRLLNLLAYLSVLYVLFMFLWGFNFNRVSFDRIVGLKVEKSSKEQLYALCKQLITKANNLREVVTEDSQGVMDVPGGYKDIFIREKQAFQNASILYPKLGGKYGKPKALLLSKAMCYTGITGIYIPYTGEANVNTKIQDFMIPNTAAHEMAHQRGFPKEDEANYIAYLACLLSPDVDFQYSGVMLALIYSMNALREEDQNGFNELKSLYSVGVRNDLKSNREFWHKYSGKIEQITNRVNNSYLKSNGQQAGTKSYGKMIDLLLAQYKESI